MEGFKTQAKYLTILVNHVSDPRCEEDARARHLGRTQILSHRLGFLPSLGSLNYHTWWHWGLGRQVNKVLSVVNQLINRLMDIGQGGVHLFLFK